MLVILVACHAKTAGDTDEPDLDKRRTQLDGRIHRLQAHLAVQESAEATHPAKLAPVQFPPSLGGPPPPLPSPDDSAAYRAHIALIGEKKLLGDMAIAASSLSPTRDQALLKTMLDGMESQLTSVEGAQRLRDHILGLLPENESPTQ